MPRLLIIDPSTHSSEPRGIETLSRHWTGETTLLLPALSPGDGPDASTGYDFDAAVLLGSRASVHDGFAWESALAQWLVPILSGAVRLPLLGICFGHQMIAHAAGALVGFAREDQSKLVGVGDSSLRGSRLLPDCSLRVVLSHCEEVKHLPAGFRCTSFREGIVADGIEHETLPLFGFQFHPEADADFLQARGVQVGHDDARMLLETSDRVIGAFMAQADSSRAPF